MGNSSIKPPRGATARSLALLLALIVLVGGCIPFIGDDEMDDEMPTPTPTFTIIRPSPTGVAEPTAAPVEQSSYTVVAGDTLQAIAAANGLDDPYPISIGQRLIIPPPPGQVPTATPAGPTIVQTPQQN